MNLHMNHPNNLLILGQNMLRNHLMLFDMLIHAASAGYATGQGDPKRMQAGLDKLARDLSDLGAFDFPNSAGNDDADRPAPASATDTKKAG